ncbi:nucleoside 2-deoxyribosyltransferase [Actinophytocola glycyrrhizae]|uniref:Nucleoside 2-deoxyribosyltransferase n=1 Tax=Actinophytocola glycyrrhizae TaxID=2044873 RepID=A0ABV9SAA9_9PSEU
MLRHSSEEADSTMGSPTADNVGQVYLAGPFTSKTENAVGANATMGMISGNSEWRGALLAAEQALRAKGWSVFLPHRDVSAWGARRITAGDVVRECLSAVKESNLVIALLEESFGTHVEVGMALGMGIPVVTVRCQDQAQSYFGGGIGPASLAGELVVPTIHRFAEVMSGAAFDRAVAAARDGAASLHAMAG